MEQLGLSHLVDALLTTNKIGKSKTDGLFAAALQHLGIKASDMAFVGDSEKRDVEPSKNEGIFSIHYAESENVQLMGTGTIKINSLLKLKHLVSDVPPRTC